MKRSRENESLPPVRQKKGKAQFRVLTESSKRDFKTQKGCWDGLYRGRKLHIF